MGVLFLVALILAWPTLGLSLLVWAVAAYLLHIKNKVMKIERREQIGKIIEPLFTDRYAEFFIALDLPTVSTMSVDESYQCGRHLVNYICHNPSESVIFIAALKKMADTESGFCHPVVAVGKESLNELKGDIHILCYWGVEAIMKNNSLKCFEKIDLSRLVKQKASLAILRELTLT